MLGHEHDYSYAAAPSGMNGTWSSANDRCKPRCLCQPRAFPPLDGGRIAVVLLESARRRKLPAEREALIYLTGFAVLMALIILISIQDIQRLLTGS